MGKVFPEVNKIFAICLEQLAKINTNQIVLDSANGASL